MAPGSMSKRKKPPIQFAGHKIYLSDLARETGIDIAYVSRVFARKQKPSLDFARKASYYLCISIEDFLDNLQEKAA